MKVLFLRFPLESAFGGAEVQTLTLMRGLIERGHAVAFLGSCPTLLKLCRDEGIPTVALDIGEPPVTKWGAISFAWRAPKMRRILEQHLAQFSELDAVCMLSLSEKLLLTETAAKKSKVLWIEHDTVGKWLTKNPWLNRLKKASKKATIVTVSALSKKLYEGMGFEASRIVAIPNGIDPSRFAHVQRMHSEPGLLRIGCIARLSSEKGIDVLLNAAKDRDDASVTIVGKGPEESALQHLARELGMDERTEITSRNDGDLTEYFSAFDVLVLPSRSHDPFGLVAAEAMMLGIPVIVTDVCGIASELRHQEDALIVKADDAAALEQALKQLSDPAVRQRIGEAGKQTSVQKFSAKRMIERYIDLMK